MLAIESINKIRDKGLEVHPGDFAENLTTENINLLKLGLGTKVRVGDQVVLKISKIGKECHNRCQIFKQVGDCVMPTEGIFARVIHEGLIKPGDEITVIKSIVKKNFK